MNPYALKLACWIVFFSFGTSLAHAAILPLESRLGGLAYYDPNLDITWAADAGISGAGDWDAANAWAATLDIAGITGWRLPHADVDGNGSVFACSGASSEIDCADNEMGFLFHKEGIANISPGPFQGVHLVAFWSGTESSTDSSMAWMFFFNVGSQSASAKSPSNNFAWAVHDGDVPEPASLALLSLGGLAMLRRGRR